MLVRANSTGTAALNADSCTFDSAPARHALYVDGGSIGGTASATLTNCTFSGNDGGAIILDDAWGALVNCTVASNSDNYVGEGIHLVSNSMSTLTLQNTIVATNSAPTGPDIYAPGANTVTSNGGNLIGNNSGFTMAALPSDQIGAAASPLNPMLWGLHTWGGPTQAYGLNPGSPAIDAGVSGGPTEDQRGTLRDANPDIGAFEAVRPQLQVTVDSVTPTNGSSRALTTDVQVGTDVPVTVNLANTAPAGTVDLLVTLPVTVSGLSNCTAAVTTPPSPSIAPGANSDLVLTVTPTSEGVYLVTLTVTTNDSANSPFTLNFLGNATAPSDDGGDDDAGCSTGEGKRGWLLALFGVAIRLRRA